MFKELYLKYKWYLLFTVPMSIMLGLVSMSVVAIISDTIGGNLKNIQSGAGLFFLTIVSLAVLGLINELLRARLFASVVYDMQVRMIRRVSSTSLSQIENIGVSKVIATLTEDVSRAVKYFHLLPQLFANTAIIVCGIGYMTYLSPLLLGIVFSGILVAGVIVFVLVMLTRRDRVQVRELTDSAIKGYQQLVEGAKELKLNGYRNAFFSRKLFGVVDGMRVRTGRIYSMLAVIDSWSQLAVFSILGGVIFVLGGYLNLSAEVIVGYVITLLFLLEPVEIVIGSADELMEARVAFDKIDNLNLGDSNEWDEIVSPEYNSTEAVDSLSLENISYEYTREHNGQLKTFSLGPLSLECKPGEVTLIVGGNGSGKSTLLKILCGLYKADKGRISLNGEMVTEKKLDKFRNHFSVIMQDFCLFEDVLDHSGKLCDDSKVNEILEKMYMLDIVSYKDSRFDRMKLSKGQCKRLALLQLYLEKRPILLLDEWAADQDPFFKEIFYRKIVPYLKSENKIVIMVSHDERYFDCADRIVKLDNGRLVNFRTLENIVYSA